MRVVVPVEQHRGQRGQQRIGNSTRTGLALIGRLRPDTTHHAHTGAQHVHRMQRGRQQFQRLLYFRRQPAQAYEPLLVRGQFLRVRQAALHQQVRYFFKLAMRSQVRDVVAAIVKIVASVAHGAKRGFACRRA